MRGREIEGVIKQYSSMVKPAYCNYIAPTMAHADIIVPRGGDNKVAIQLIVQHVHTQLQLVSSTQSISIQFQIIQPSFRFHVARLQTKGTPRPLVYWSTDARFIASTANDATDQGSAHIHPKSGYVTWRIHFLLKSFDTFGHRIRARSDAVQRCQDRDATECAVRR